MRRIGVSGISPAGLHWMGILMENSGNSAQVQHVHKLFLQHHGELRGFILALLPDYHLANDLVHEVFLLATAKADSFREGTNFFAWVKAMARLKVLETARLRRANALFLSDEVIELLCTATPESGANERQVEAIRSCVQALPSRAKTLIDLRYRLECKPAEIASRIGWQAKSVYVELSRARDLLRECLQRKLATYEE